MDSFFKVSGIYFWDYEKLHSTILSLHYRYYKLRGLSTDNSAFRDRELEHIKSTLKTLNCEFFKRYNYEPLFTPP